ncbi:MAG TPA: hypothetical protein EYH06_03960 [Chromatiales bacterium]|nr:hypothetical protein [Thiotrichales bacterium]HIP67728.1 hypothetical protein [Chromatiales bacterium]
MYIIGRFLIVIGLSLSLFLFGCAAVANNKQSSPRLIETNLMPAKGEEKQAGVSSTTAPVELVKANYTTQEDNETYRFFHRVSKRESNNI